MASLDDVPVWDKCPVELPDGYTILKGDITTPLFENRYWVRFGRSCVELPSHGPLKSRIEVAIRMLGGAVG